MLTALNSTSTADPAPAEHLEDSVIALLKNDHALIRKLFIQFDIFARKEDIKGKLKVANRICAELVAHTLAEEEVFYPEARLGMQDERMLNEALVEHENARDLIAQILSMSPEHEVYDAKVKVLGEYIQHHVEEEESVMFPQIGQDPARDLKETALLFKVRKKKIMQLLCNSQGEIELLQLRALIGFPCHH